MPKITYITKSFNSKSLNLIYQANEIISEYLNDDLQLTIRQLYYQFVARDILPNTVASYKCLVNLISNARLAGLVDWLAIEDRTRYLRESSHFSDPGEAILAISKYFRLDKWKDQIYRPEVWIEKEALIGVISNICSFLDVPYFACKGYVSQSEMWYASMRFQGYSSYDQFPIIFHLGDHDPSGIDMTRDIEERLSTLGSQGVEIKRIALNLDQIKKYNPPPNPAKITDSRFRSYLNNFGTDSWELDALEPKVLRNLIRSAVLPLRDEEIYQATLDQEKEYLKTLSRIEKRWHSL